MKIILKILVILQILVQTIAAQSISLEGGANYFLGDLRKEIKICPYGGANFEYVLSNYTALYVQGTFSYLKLKNNKDFHGLYQMLGRTGIETPEHLLKPVAIGLGVSMATVRGKNATPQAENYMLSTSETEFGWHVRLELSMFNIEKFKFGTRFHYDEIWTKPKNSSLLQGGVFVAYAI